MIDTNFIFISVTFGYFKNKGGEGEEAAGVALLGDDRNREDE